MPVELSLGCRRALELAHRMAAEEKSRGHFVEDKPGVAALELFPSLLSELSSGVRSIVVTGTNGKTMTARFICAILDAAGIEYFSNREGANMSGRIATLFAENFSSVTGPREHLAVLECDEGYLRRVLPEITPDILVITNIYPDQIGRFGSEEHVAELILSAMEGTRPAVCVIASDCRFKEIFAKRTDWDFVEYAFCGNGISICGKDCRVHMQVPGAFNLQNAAAAARCGEILGISRNIIVQGIEKTGPAFGRMESFRHGDASVMLTLAKNKAGFDAISDYIRTERAEAHPDGNRKDTWIVAMNRNEGDDSDIGWLFENSYADASRCFEKTLIAGNCSEALKVRMDRECMNPIEIPMDGIFDYTSRTDGNVVITANYTAMMEIRKKYASEGVVKPYWEN